MDEILGNKLTYPNWWRLEDFQHKQCLVAATGRCLWDDIEKFDYSGMDIMAVKDAVIHFPDPVHHAFSQHADQLVPMIEIRNLRNPSARRQNNAIIGHTSVDTRFPSLHAWNLPGHGTSTLGAVYVALALGYKRVVIAGAPLDDSGHYFDPPGFKTHFEKRIPDKEKGPKFWELVYQDVFKGRVRSLSGRTRDLLGDP